MISKTLLEEAKKLIGGDRQKEYGDKLIEFSKDEIEKKFFQNNNIERRKNNFYPIDIPSGCTIEEIKSRVSKLKEQRGY